MMTIQKYLVFMLHLILYQVFLVVHVRSIFLYPVAECCTSTKENGLMTYGHTALDAEKKMVHGLVNRCTKVTLYVNLLQ